MSTDVAHDSELLLAERDRAERRLNGVRAGVLCVLLLAALFYAPALPARINAVNAIVLVPMLAWTALQVVLFHARARLPSWLAIVNPVADIAAVTVTMGGYGLEAGPALALKSPMVLAYFVILAARPIASSVRKSAVVAVLVVIAYAMLDVLFIVFGHITLHDPLVASTGAGVALLDEGAKLVLLAVAGGIATYATWWHESMARQYACEASGREQLRVRLAASRLDSLKQQLQPHFLFNALNAISALVDSDPRGAQRMVSGLGELIRVSLDGGGDQEVSLERELTVLGHYVSIQRIRFEDRLVVVTEVDDSLRQALVPALILQPLVENAIKHGLAQRAGPTRIEVRAGRDGDAVVLSVTDDGPGLAGRPVSSIVERVGVGNARARLAYLYGRRHGFSIDSPPEGGFTVRIRIPYRTASDSGALAERAS